MGEARCDYCGSRMVSAYCAECGRPMAPKGDPGLTEPAAGTDVRAAPSPEAEPEATDEADPSRPRTSGIVGIIAASVMAVAAIAIGVIIMIDNPAESQGCRVAPAGRPRVGFVVPSALSDDEHPTVPLRLAWSASSTPEVTYDVHLKEGDSPWAPATDTIEPTTQQDAAIYSIYQVRVGASGSCLAEPTTSKPLLVKGYQQYQADSEGAWTFLQGPDYWGGDAKTTTEEGATIRLTLGGNRVAVVGTAGPLGGEASVAIDGQPAGTVNAWAPTTTHRAVLASFHVTGPGPHVLELVKLPSDDVTTLELDGFVSLRSAH